MFFQLLKVSFFISFLTKEYYHVPKIRKENIFCESDHNSIHQIALFDYIYDQQDIYNFYENQTKFPSLEIKEPSKLFSHELIALETFLNDFATDDEAFRHLVNLRFYSYNEELPYLDDLEHATEFIIHPKKHLHPLVDTLEYITEYVILFAKLSKKYIQKYEGNNIAFANEYLKRVLI